MKNLILFSLCSLLFSSVGYGTERSFERYFLDDDAMACANGGQPISLKVRTINVELSTDVSSYRSHRASELWEGVEQSSPARNFISHLKNSHWQFELYDCESGEWQGDQQFIMGDFVNRHFSNGVAAVIDPTKVGSENFELAFSGSIPECVPRMEVQSDRQDIVLSLLNKSGLLLVSRTKCTETIMSQVFVNMFLPGSRATDLGPQAQVSRRVHRFTKDQAIKNTLLN